MKEGPSLVSLTDRLLQCPGSFLFTPIVIYPESLPKNSLFLPALFSDLYFHILGEFPDSLQLEFLNLTPTKENINLLSIYSITSYLLSIPFFHNKPSLKNPLLMLYKKQLVTYREVVLVNKFIQDPERREELIRFCLHHLGFYPQGETEKYAIGRLSTLDSIERIKLISETRKAQLKREEEIREAIRKREAEEAASRMTGE